MRWVRPVRLKEGRVAKGKPRRWRGGPLRMGGGSQRLILKKGERGFDG